MIYGFDDNKNKVEMYPIQTIRRATSGLSAITIDVADIGASNINDVAILGMYYTMSSPGGTSYQSDTPSWVQGNSATKIILDIDNAKGQNVVVILVKLGENVE